MIARRSFYFWIGFVGLMLFCTHFSPGAHCEESNRKVAATKSVRMMWRDEKLKAMDDATKHGRYALLGARGELYAPVRRDSTPMGDIFFVPVGEELELVAHYNMTVVANVRSNGRIEVADDAQLGDVENFPRRWPRDRKGRLLLTLPVGAILQNEKPKKYKISSAPSGAIGWVVPMCEDCIFMPKQDGVRPRDFYWIVPEEDHGFRLIHGGPAQNGTYLSVAPDRKITYGEASNEIECREEGQRYWTYVFHENGKQVPISEGCLSGVRGSPDEQEVFFFENGVLRGANARMVY